ncbi:TPA: OsmC family protein [Pseudomonas aeruginosa]|nr:OsmC family peroxiredoxin [Stenotrophomonas sp.]HEJ1321109.1 OsmC family protein [Pseudomonas aeruginosa]
MTSSLNGINVPAFQEFADTIRKEPSNAEAKFEVNTRWDGQTRSVASVKSYDLRGQSHARDFTIVADEPTELLGTNTAPNPQELLMAALNACMTVGYVANAAAMGITVRSLEIDTIGSLDLRGFLGLDENVNPGYDEVQYTVRIDADGTPEQMEQIHQAVMRTSPNFANFARAIRMVPKLVVGGK